MVEERVAPAGSGWSLTSEQFREHLNKEKQRRRWTSTMRSTIYILVVVAAVAILVATLWLPVLKIYGSSMTPSLEEGNIVFTIKSGRFDPGDIVGFYYENKLLVKRCIAGPGDWVDIKDDGTVIVNQVEIDEPYLTEKALGDCNIDLPYQVPDERYFVMGDHRATSVDSRHTSVGCIAEEQIVGKIVFRIWPLDEFGSVRLA